MTAHEFHMGWSTYVIQANPQARTDVQPNQQKGEHAQTSPPTHVRGAMSLACFLLTLLGRVVTVQLKNGSFVTGLVLEVDQHSKLRVGVSSAPPALSVPGPCVGCLCETVGCVSIQIHRHLCVCLGPTVWYWALRSSAQRTDDTWSCARRWWWADWCCRWSCLRGTIMTLSSRDMSVCLEGSKSLASCVTLPCAL